jgi:hypothetical protein
LWPKAQQARLATVRIKMRVWSARRLAVALGVLALLGRGARRLRLLLASLLLRLRPAALTNGGASASSGETWRLFSSLLDDLQAHKVARVLLAADHCVVQPADGLAAYKCVSGLACLGSARLADPLTCSWRWWRWP